MWTHYPKNVQIYNDFWEFKWEEKRCRTSNPGLIEETR